jgi:hypothetical protein
LRLAGRSSSTYLSMTFEILGQHKFDPVEDKINKGKIDH